MNTARFLEIARDIANGFGVEKTIYLDLKTKVFNDGRVRTIAIEQNPKTNTRWARLAQQGNRVVQFKQHGKYVAAVVNEKQITVYRH